jgi:hypothetical protein
MIKMMIKMKRLNIFIIAVLLLAPASCNRDELFEREQYKKVFALMSGDDKDNIFAEEHDLRLHESEGFVTAVCGGSLPSEKDINITLVEAPEILRAYNIREHDLNMGEYARPVPESQYDIDNFNVTIPAGSRNGLLKIRLRANGLSPDSLYFIPLRVQEFSAYELNPDKSYVMYRVLLRNYYSRINTARAATDYNFRGKRNEANTMGIKQVFPVADDKVRIVAGDIAFEASNLEGINTNSILLHIDRYDSVHISPWKDIVVTQVNGDPDYPNIFKIYDDGYKTYKTFLLRYDYEYNGNQYTMREELRLEFNKRDETEF